MSTLVGWTVIICFAGYYVFRYTGGRRRDAPRAPQRQRLDDRQSTQARKEPKAKRQRVEAFGKDAEDSAKATQPKPRPAKPSTPTQPAGDSSDDGVDNREFARQLASVKQGTILNTSKKPDEKRQKSVKQSRAREIEPKVDHGKVSAPSSTAGVDGDDDESSIASPEIKAADALDVSDMLEPKSTGPSVLRLTGTDKVKTKVKKVKPAEEVETKKQRQNRQKVEAAKAEREEAEKQRKIAMEAQRRLARISEGRAAKDGPSSVASQPAQSAWNGSSAKFGSNGTLSNGEHAAVQPLDTFDSSSRTNAAAPKPAAPKPVAAAPTKDESWMSSLPSEEEQMELLRKEEAWSTVKTKKSVKPKKESATESAGESEPTVIPVQPSAPVAAAPAIVAKAPKVNGSGKPTKSFSQQSSFAALSTNEEPEVEEEWDV